MKLQVGRMYLNIFLRVTNKQLATDRVLDLATASRLIYPQYVTEKKLEDTIPRESVSIPGPEQGDITGTFYNSLKIHFFAFLNTVSRQYSCIFKLLVLLVLGIFNNNTTHFK